MLCLRHAQLPVALMTGSFSDYDRAIHLSVAQYDHPLNPTEIWGVKRQRTSTGACCRPR
ncbi:MAG: hypothetical protein R2856_07785 [Caldilineaceae bacterium]